MAPECKGSIENYRTLLEVVEAIASHRDLSALFHQLAQVLRRIVPYDFLNLILHDREKNVVRIHLMESDQSREQEGLEFGLDEAPSGEVLQTQQPLVVADMLEESRWPRIRREVFAPAGIRSGCMFPLTTARARVGVLSFLSTRPNAYQDVNLEFVSLLGRQVAVAVENAQAFRCIEVLNSRLEKERVYLEEELRTRWDFEEIVGDSPALARLLGEVSVVAPTDSTVLIRGETGTGKELIARALHEKSGRRGRTLVKINCSAIPTGLLESELFGHEKGAFTGAVSQRVGRFEIAHEGTLFLDEIGDIPLELQPKLLRVLQEQEFERLGGSRTLRVNVRMIAATHRDLGAMVREGSFREDLYYRLNVFPLNLPALRDRPADIPALVRHFTQKFARRMGRRIETISTEIMQALVRYSWPGNIRELENFVERAVILSSGDTLQAPVGELKATAPASARTAEPGTGVVPMVEAEKEHILRALREARWQVGGPTGAAARLGMNRTTLQSRMKKFGIERPR